jgi:hypothetical protein
MRGVSGCGAAVAASSSHYCLCVCVSIFHLRVLLNAVLQVLWMMRGVCGCGAAAAAGSWAMVRDTTTVNHSRCVQLGMPQASLCEARPFALLAQPCIADSAVLVLWAVAGVTWLLGHVRCLRHPDRWTSQHHRCRGCAWQVQHDGQCSLCMVAAVGVLRIVLSWQAGSMRARPLPGFPLMQQRFPPSPCLCTRSHLAPFYPCVYALSQILHFAAPWPSHCATVVPRLQPLHVHRQTRRRLQLGNR